MQPSVFILETLVTVSVGTTNILIAPSKKQNRLARARFQKAIEVCMFVLNRLK